MGTHYRSVTSLRGISKGVGSKEVEDKTSRHLGSGTWAEETADCARRQNVAKGVGAMSAFPLRATGNHNRVLYGDILLRMTLMAAWTGDPSRV